MKKLLLILIVFTLKFSDAKAIQLIFSSKQGKTDSIDLKVKKLKRLYTLSTSSSGDSVIYQQQFFDAFPNTFNELNEIYGYEHNTPAPLYEDGVKHIYELFNNLKNINDTLYYRKIISIAINGHWDVDAINYFQSGLRNRVLADPDLTAYILQNLPEKNIYSFWYFYFDATYPKRKISEPLLKIESINIRIYDLMLKAQAEVLKQRKE